MPGDGEGGKEAFCLLLWRRNGGVVTPELKINKQAFDQEGVLQRYIRGYCTRPWDCFSCPDMQDELKQYEPGKAVWLCSDCADLAISQVRSAGLPHRLPGYFTEGQCQNTACPRPAIVTADGSIMKDDQGNDLPPGWSPFLQLFIQG